MTRLDKDVLVLVCNHCKKEFKKEGMPNAKQLSDLSSLNKFANENGWHVYGSGMALCQECAKIEIVKL